MKVSVTAIALAFGVVMCVPVGASAADLSKDQLDQMKTEKSTTEKTITEESSTDLGVAKTKHSHHKKAKPHHHDHEPVSHEPGDLPRP